MGEHLQGCNAPLHRTSTGADPPQPPPVDVGSSAVHRKVAACRQRPGVPPVAPGPDADVHVLDGQASQERARGVFCCLRASEHGSRIDEEWQLRRVRVPKGTHFSGSKDTPGAERELLREDGTNKLLGPPESFPVDEDPMLGVHAYAPDSPRRADARELSPEQRAIVDAIVDGGAWVLRYVPRDPRNSKGTTVLHGRLRRVISSTSTRPTLSPITDVM